MDLDQVQAGGGGVPGAIARAGLTLLAGGWWAAWRLRKAAYDLRPSLGRRLPVPVVSVGNLAVGGTGKTPFVAWLAGRLLEEGRRPGILARGYGPKTPHTGLSDEGAVLRHLLGDRVPQVEQPRRVDGGRRLLRDHPETDVLLLDDGFQHWRLARDLDVVLLDAMNPFGYGHLLPRGRLREPPSALARADVVVLTRAERVPDEAAATIERLVGDYTSAPVVRARTRPESLALADRVEPTAWLAGRRVAACCGIGNPHAFVGTLEDLGAEVVSERFLPDHAAPSALDWEAFQREADAAGASCVVTTRKDAVKHPQIPEGVAILDVAPEIVRGEDTLLDRVRAAIR